MLLNAHTENSQSVRKSGLFFNDSTISVWEFSQTRRQRICGSCAKSRSYYSNSRVTAEVLGRFSNETEGKEDGIENSLNRDQIMYAVRILSIEILYYSYQVS